MKFLYVPAKKNLDMEYKKERGIDLSVSLLDDPEKPKSYLNQMRIKSVSSSFPAFLDFPLDSLPQQTSCILTYKILET